MYTGVIPVFFTLFWRKKISPSFVNVWNCHCLHFRCLIAVCWLNDITFTFTTGNQVLQLAISDNFVWALDPNGEIMCRHGITTTNPGGDYWRKIPGVFNQISCKFRVFKFNILVLRPSFISGEVSPHQCLPVNSVKNKLHYFLDDKR